MKSEISGYLFALGISILGASLGILMGFVIDTNLERFYAKRFDSQERK